MTSATEQRLEGEANVQDADTLVRLMSAWSSLPATKFNAAYPFFDKDRQRVIAEYGLADDHRAKLEATALLFAEYADDIYVSGAAQVRRRRITTPIEEQSS